MQWELGGPAVEEMMNYVLLVLSYFGQILAELRSNPYAAAVLMLALSFGFVAYALNLILKRERSEALKSPEGHRGSST